MNHPRETISAAFFNLFSGLGGGNPFTTVSRVLEVPGNIDASTEPALYWSEDFELDNENQESGLQEYKLLSRLVIFAAMPDISSGIVPGSVLNPLIDAADNAMLGGSPPGERQTLGGLVNNCWIDGRIIKVAGYLGQHIACVIPISFLTGA